MLNIEAEQSPTQTPVYSCFPPDVTTGNIKTLEYLTHKLSLEDRATFPKLPWSLESLLGTKWRQIHAGSLREINKIITDEHGNLYPMCEDGDKEKPYFIKGIGLWWNGIFCIEHWVRIDHLSVEEQLAWMGVEIQGIREYIGNPQVGSEVVKMGLKRIEFIKEEILEFARQHNITFNTVL